MKLKIDYSPAGAGKTTAIRNYIAANPKGRYLIAQPSYKVLAENEKKLRAMVPSSHYFERVDGEDKANETVTKRLTSALERLENGTVACTHAGLCRIDPKLLEGVTVFIDEVPGFLGTFRLSPGDFSTVKRYLEEIDGTLRLTTEGRALANSSRRLTPIEASVRKALRFARDHIHVRYAPQHGHMVGTAFNPKIIEHAEECYLMSATPETQFFPQYASHYGIEPELVNLVGEYGPQRSDRVLFSPYMKCGPLPPCIEIEIVPLYEGSRRRPTPLLSLHRLNKEAERDKIALKLSTLYRAGGPLHGRKNRTLAVMNAREEIRSDMLKGAKLLKLGKDDRVLSPGESGTNQYTDIDTVVYLAATRACREEYKAVYSTLNLPPPTEEGFLAHERLRIQGNMYQACMRSKLRDLDTGSLAQIRLVVYGPQEAEILSEALGGGIWSPK